MRRLVWIVTALAVACYGLLIWVGMDAYAGQKPLDLRVFGYSYDQAMSLVAALPMGAAERIVTEVRLIDTCFPVLFGLAMAGWGWLASTGRGLGVRAAAILVPFAYTATDLYENALVATILSRAIPTEAMVQAASTATMVKFALVALAGLLLFWLASGKED